MNKILLVSNSPRFSQEINSALSEKFELSVLNYAIEGIIGYSTAPLRFSVFIGSITAIAAVLYLICVVCEKLFWGIAIPGYATIIVLILLLGSIQLFCIGIIGEYVGRTFEQSKNRPVYIAKEILSYDEK